MWRCPADGESSEREEAATAAMVMMKDGNREAREMGEGRE